MPGSASIHERLARRRRPSPSMGLHVGRAGAGSRDVFDPDVFGPDVFGPVVLSVDDLVTVGGRRGDERALLTRFLLGLTVARLDGGVVRRRRRTRPTRGSSCQKCNRAAAANEAAHLIQYKRANHRRQRPPGDAESARALCPYIIAASLAARGRHAPRSGGAARPSDSSAMPRPPTSTPVSGRLARLPIVGLPASHFGRQTVSDCRSPANRRGLWAPMAAVS